MSPRIKLTLLALGLQAALAGCSAAMPPQELVDARRAYDHARTGQAKDLVPAEVLAAQQALDRAERAFESDPASPTTRDLAYLAQRRAEIAEARAVVAAANRDEASARQDVTQLRTWEAQRAKALLSETRAEAAAQRTVLQAQQEQLTAEQRARREADRRAAAAMASLERIAAVKEEARGVVITLNGAVLFATGQATLLPIAEERLRQVAEALQESSDGAIVVEGHTDSTGPKALNEDLSRRRAEAVRAYLVGRGVDADRIRAVGLGPSRPVAENATPEGRANNRRVEIVIERRKNAD